MCHNVLISLDIQIVIVIMNDAVYRHAYDCFIIKIAYFSCNSIAIMCNVILVFFFMFLFIFER